MSVQHYWGAVGNSRHPSKDGVFVCGARVTTESISSTVMQDITCHGCKAVLVASIGVLIPDPPTWRSTDPRHDLVDRKWARIVILRPKPNGHGWEAGTGHVEMKHGWHVSTSFSEKPHVGGDDTWDSDWLWTLEPEYPR